ncbi:flavodoxin [Pigmentiphaga aceris]|uniref:Flavodoxin n=1 Tax=Pigmentiphaga aceris TaxID=1940612 RepID=A0A5C0AWQ6_9BURK|nr:flavodoxin [Pigmentiphaga aceris]QEI05823.1 flavodoxin [Pigmentiphaga aceris]
MSKILIVMYSRTGTCRGLATRLSRQQGWPLGEISDADASPSRASKRGTWQCLLDSWRRREPPIRYDGPRPAEFDIVVTVSPIWLYRLAGPMRSFLAEHRVQLRQLAVVSVMGKRGAPNALAEITRLTNRRPVAELAIAKHELDEESVDRKLTPFATKLGNWEPNQSDANTHAWLAPRA